MQVYMRSNFIYSFDREKTLSTRYMAGNSKLSQEHRKHNEKDISQKCLFLEKKKEGKN